MNHIAFDSPLDELDAKRDRWLDHGLDVRAHRPRLVHVDLRRTIPNGIMVEFCATTRAFTADDHREAQELLAAAMPPLNKVEPPIQFFEARSRDDATVS